jgi:molybdenum cofactor cytidylyltransferase
MLNTGIIILAAGSSSRLGRPKQLLSYKGKSLICNIVDAAIDSKPDQIIVVTGYLADEVSKELDKRKVELVFNKHWEEGMGSGIVIGLNRLLQLKSEIQNVILTVCDQPFVTSDFLSNLLSGKNKSKKTIVASAYAGTYGTPTLFDRTHFQSLLSLKGTEGAKKLLEQLKEDMISVPFEKGSLDIDTEADYIKLIND